MNFLNIKNAVAAQFNAMTVSGRLFLTNVSKDDILNVLKEVAHVKR